MVRPSVGSFATQVGERVVHINGVPVFQQADFEKVLTGATQCFASRPLWLKTSGIPFWLVGEFTTNFSLF